MEEGLTANYGHIGPALVQNIIREGLHENPDRLRDQIKKLSRQIAGTSEGIDARAARPFALLWCAGEMAKEWGLLPASLDMKTAIHWAWSSFRFSSEAEALDPAGRAISHLQEWIQARWDVTIKPVEQTSDAFGRVGTNNREADGWYDEESVYIPKSRLSHAAGDVLTEIDVAKAIEKIGAISRSQDNRRLYIRYVPKRGRLNAYALSRHHFGKSDKSADIKGAVA